MLVRITWGEEEAFIGGLPSARNQLDVTCSVLSASPQLCELDQASYLTSP